MLNTEDWESPNITWEILPGAPLIIAFTGMARGLNELANFEFGKTFKPMEYSKIFVRDPHLSFYQYGVGEGTHNVWDVRDRLADVIEPMRPSKIICVGVSAGGYAALLFGHMLKVDTAHAFGPQVILHKQWGIDHNDATIRDTQLHQGPPLLPENDFRDLPKVLEQGNGKTRYKVHIGNECTTDLNHARLIEHCPGVELVLYPGNAHAVATQILRAQGRLGEVITND
jgi:hypothetical protein